MGLYSPRYNPKGVPLEYTHHAFVRRHQQRKRPPPGDGPVWLATWYNARAEALIGGWTTASFRYFALLSPARDRVFARGELDWADTLRLPTGDVAVAVHADPGVLEPDDRGQDLGTLLYYTAALAAARRGAVAIYSRPRQRMPGATRLWTSLHRRGLAHTYRIENAAATPVDLLFARDVPLDYAR